MKVAMMGGYSIEKILKKPTGAIDVHINKLAYHLSRRNDIELHLITFDKENKQFKKGNLNVHVLKRLFPIPFYLPIEVLLLMRKIQRINPDIVHAHESWLPYSTAAALIRNRNPILLTVHSIVATEFEFRTGTRSVISSFVSKLNEKYVLSKIPNIITVSAVSKDVLGSITNSKIHVIPNGVDFEDAQDVQPFQSIEHPLILFVGRLVKIKGIDLLLKAVPIIKKSIPNIHLYIAGKGPQETELKKLIKQLGIEENVKFLGIISGEEKYSYYKSADVCVLPSRNENLPLVLLEALMCGKPVVASDVGDMPFIVENKKTGLLFKCGDVNELAEKIIILLKNRKSREKMGEAGREKMKEFTWEKIANKTVEIYKEILQIGI